MARDPSAGPNIRQMKIHGAGLEWCRAIESIYSFRIYPSIDNISFAQVRFAILCLLIYV